MKKTLLILCCICLPIYALESTKLLNARIPADIPPAVISFVDKKHKANSTDEIGYWIKYISIWKGNLEIYATQSIYEPIKSDSEIRPLRIIGLPQIVIYDCHEARNPLLEELYDIKFYMPKYYKTGNIKSEHLCHRDLDAFNQHNTPNPYKKRVKYYTPKYIPKPVVKYINKKYPVSWYPGLTKRYIKYLTIFDNKYEVYFVYWKDSKSDFNSTGKYILYDCQNVREYKNNSERIRLMSIASSEVSYNSIEKPNFCKSK